MVDPEAAIEQLLKDEGDKFITDHYGRGACKYGITLKTALETHPDWTAQSIKDLSWRAAADFYLYDWWDRYHFNLLEDQNLAAKVFNISVNVGPATAIRWLQQAAGGLDAGIEVDGILGPQTATKVNLMDPSVLLAQFKESAKAHYLALGPQYDDVRNGLVRRAEE